MSEVNASTLWGEWVLGDLADAARLIADALGTAAQVASLSVSAPEPGFGEGAGLTVRVVTSSELQHKRLRRAITTGEWVTENVFEPTDTHWSGFVAGVYLVLTVKGSAEDAIR